MFIYIYVYFVCLYMYIMIMYMEIAHLWLISQAKNDYREKK